MKGKEKYCASRNFRCDLSFLEKLLSKIVQNWKKW